MQRTYRKAIINTGMYGDSALCDHCEPLTIKNRHNTVLTTVLRAIFQTVECNMVQSVLNPISFNIPFEESFHGLQLDPH